MSVEYCEICSIEYKLDKLYGSLIHDQSNTHDYNYFNKLKELDQANGLDQADIYVLRRKRELFDNTNYQCVMLAWDKDCNFEGSLSEVLQHEKHCLEEFRNTNEKNHIEVFENYKFIQCDLCDKKFYEKGQKLKPIYALNLHKKSCSNIQIKKKVAHLIEHLKSFKNVRTKEEKDYIDNLYESSLLW